VPDESDAGSWIHTHGLRKFGRPELEVYDVRNELAPATSWLFLDLASYLVDGALIRPGETLGDPKRPVGIRIGARDREHWEEIPVLELVDVDDAGMQARGAARGLAAWADFDPGA
jgi:hypothetical protein